MEEVQFALAGNAPLANEHKRLAWSQAKLAAESGLLRVINAILMAKKNNIRINNNFLAEEYAHPKFKSALNCWVKSAILKHEQVSEEDTKFDTILYSKMHIHGFEQRFAQAFRVVINKTRIKNKKISNERIEPSEPALISKPLTVAQTKYTFYFLYTMPEYMLLAHAYFPDTTADASLDQGVMTLITNSVRGLGLLMNILLAHGNPSIAVGPNPERTIKELEADLQARRYGSPEKIQDIIEQFLSKVPLVQAALQLKSEKVKTTQNSAQRWQNAQQIQPRPMIWPQINAKGPPAKTPSPSKQNMLCEGVLWNPPQRKCENCNTIKREIVIRFEASCKKECNFNICARCTLAKIYELQKLEEPSSARCPRCNSTINSKVLEALQIFVDQRYTHVSKIKCSIQHRPNEHVCERSGNIQRMPCGKSFCKDCLKQRRVPFTNMIKCTCKSEPHVLTPEAFM